MTSTVKSTGYPSSGSVEKNTLHACKTSTPEKLSCVHTAGENVPSSPESASVAVPMWGVTLKSSGKMSNVPSSAHRFCSKVA